MDTPSVVDLRQGGRQIERVVELARRHLAMDVAYVVELTDGGPVAHHVCGDAAPFGFVPDMTPIAGGSCWLPAPDDVPPLERDARSDAEGTDGTAPVAPSGPCAPGACAGVALRLPDGELYGFLCAVRREADQSLDARDVRFLEMLGELIVDELHRERQRATTRRSVEALIERQALRIACQPIVDLRDGRCIGVEALARFGEPFEQTEQTFALAHEVGLGLELERLSAGHAWKLRHRIRADQFVSINLSPDVAATLARRARRHTGLPLSQTVLEITEHTAVRSYRALRDELEPMREGGLRVAIDDAGAGYASLQHIVELHPDFIKIDRSLVDHVAVDRARRSTVSSFVVLALDLNSVIVAEGVENADDLAALRDLGVDAAQGYLLARPSADPNDFARWVEPSPPVAVLDDQVA